MEEIIIVSDKDRYRERYHIVWVTYSNLNKTMCGVAVVVEDPAYYQSIILTPTNFCWKCCKEFGKRRGELALAEEA